LLVSHAFSDECTMTPWRTARDITAAPSLCRSILRSKKAPWVPMGQARKHAAVVDKFTGVAIGTDFNFTNYTPHHLAIGIEFE
jgi:hypothetical protein